MKPISQSDAKQRGTHLPPAGQPPQDPDVDVMRRALAYAGFHPQGSRADAFEALERIALRLSEAARDTQRIDFVERMHDSLIENGTKVGQSPNWYVSGAFMAGPGKPTVREAIDAAMGLRPPPKQEEASNG